jgi:hypothetical protein
MKDLMRDFFLMTLINNHKVSRQQMMCRYNPILSCTIFCYLMQARGDIAGMTQSTFYQFAALFGTSHLGWLIAPWETNVIPSNMITIGLIQC